MAKIVTLILALMFSEGIAAATITVRSLLDSGGTCPGADCTLRQAIAAAAAGDTIDFSLPANNPITLTSGQLSITKNLTIKGPGANRLTIQRSSAAGTGNFRIFAVSGTVGASIEVVISGLTLTNGKVIDSVGGGIYSAYSSLTISSSTIANNFALGNTVARGGGVANTVGGTVFVVDSTISGNSATLGGGISSSSGLQVLNSTVSGNTADYGGGVYATDATLNFTNSTVTGNTANGSGGGVSNTSFFVIRNSIVALNSAPNDTNIEGSASSQGFNIIGVNSPSGFTPTTGDQTNVSAAALNLGVLKDNGGPTKTHAPGSGSVAIERGNSFFYNTDQRGLARPVDSLTVPNATGGDGSDIGAYEVQADVLPGCNTINKVVSNNNDSGPGSLRAVIASVCAGSTITFAPNVTGVINLTSGELPLARSVTIVGPGAKLLTVRRNVAAQFRVFSIDDSLAIVSISGLTIANGNANDHGGAIVNYGTLTISKCAITDNHSDFDGGGIRSYNKLTVVDSTIAANTAAGTDGGGGLYVEGTTEISRSTISGNSSSSGGGLLTGGGAANITSSTIAGNTASVRGGGIRVNVNTPRFKNTIVAQNNSPLGPDISGVIRSENFNLVGDSSGATITFSQFEDQIGIAASQIEPLLGPLSDNGGPTPTRALLTGSPAIDKGTANAFATDQRGFTRVIDSPTITNAGGAGDGSDIGAYEVQADFLAGCDTINKVVSNGNNTGAGSLRTVIAEVCTGTTITFAPNVTAVNLTTAQLSITKSMHIAGPGARNLAVQGIGEVMPYFRIFNVAANLTVTISGMTISNGFSVGNRGGGINNQGTLTLDRVTISGNRAISDGGGINNDFGLLTITNSTISGNTISSPIFAGSGGGIFNQGGIVNIINTTISGNTAIGPGANSDSGGGLITNVGSVTIDNSTIAANSGDIGGGIRIINGGTVRVKNTIIAMNNSANGPDVNGPLTSEGFNLIGNGTGATIMPILASDQFGTGVDPIDPLLGMLGDNGGPTNTMALTAGSPAIDRGTANGLTVDQRGSARTSNDFSVPDAVGSDGTDIGAFEVKVPVTLDIDASITASKYDAPTDGLLMLRYLFELAGNSLTANALGGTATRIDPVVIKAYLDANRLAFDIDGNGNTDALTDGVLIVRYLFGIRGESLRQNAIGPGATRVTTMQIEDYLIGLTP